MYALATIAFALVATAVARPQDSTEGKAGDSVTVEQTQNQCTGGNAQQLSCCEDSTENGLLSVLSDLTILGGTCSDVGVNVAVLGSVEDPAGTFCSGNQVACCPAGTSGSSTGCTALSG